MPIIKQSRFNRNYRTVREGTSAGDFVELVLKVTDLSWLRTLQQSQVHLQFEETILVGDIAEAQRLLAEVQPSERLDLAQAILTTNSNPLQTIHFFVQPVAQQVLLDATNVPRVEAEQVLKLLLEHYPEAQEQPTRPTPPAGARMQSAQEPPRHFDDVYLPGPFRPVPMPELSERDVFVIMSFSREQRDAYNLAIAPTLKRLRLRPRRIDEVQHNATVTVEIVRHIERALFVVADLTGERPNVYYEVGYAHRANKEVVLLARKGTAIHFDVAAINRIDYEDFTELVDALEKRVRAIADRIGLDLPDRVGDS